MKILGKRFVVPDVYFFSSTTYKTDYFDRCVYCHSNVENDYFEYNEEIIGMPYRCNCDEAVKELKIKEEFFENIIQLQKDIDSDRINNVTKHALINMIEDAYEDENEEKLKYILD